MIKSLISVTLLTFGLAAGSMAAEMPKSAAPMSADTGSHAKAGSHKHHASHKASHSRKSHRTASAAK